MSSKVRREEDITTAEAKEILLKLSEKYEFDQFQRRVLDYAVKFSKLPREKARELVDKLVDEFEVDRKEAIQIVNCMPESIEELRTFFAGGRRRIVPTELLENILRVLDENRE